MTPSTALRLTGADALALLHRIGTNALADLAPGQARATLFCDFRGRLLHRALAGLAGDRSVWLLHDHAPGDALAAFLDRHIFRDDVRIEDRSDSLPIHWRPGDDRFAIDALTERDGQPLAIRVGPGETLTVGDQAPGADDLARIRAGRAAHGHEIAEAFTPFEVGLSHEVHLDKGCFTGQEALMRLITYQSVKRRLVRVSGPGVVPAVPADLTAGAQAAGVLTSAAADAGGWLGLAVVRSEYIDPPQPLALAGGAVIAAVEPVRTTRPLGRP